MKRPHTKKLSFDDYRTRCDVVTDPRMDLISIHVVRAAGDGRGVSMALWMTATEADDLSRALDKSVCRLRGIKH